MDRRTERHLGNEALRRVGVRGYLVLLHVWLTWMLRWPSGLTQTGVDASPSCCKTVLGSTREVLRLVDGIALWYDVLQAWLWTLVHELRRMLHVSGLGSVGRRRSGGGRLTGLLRLVRSTGDTCRPLVAGTATQVRRDCASYRWGKDTKVSVMDMGTLH